MLDPRFGAEASITDVRQCNSNTQECMRVSLEGPAMIMLDSVLDSVGYIQMFQQARANVGRQEVTYHQPGIAGLPTIKPAKRNLHKPKNALACLMVYNLLREEQDWEMRPHQMAYQKLEMIAAT